MAACSCDWNRRGNEMAKNRAKGKRPGAIGNAVVDGVLAELKKAGGDAAVGAAPDGVSPNSNGHGANWPEQIANRWDSSQVRGWCERFP